MTTVAVKDGVMAADTQLTGDSIHRVPKIFELPDGGLIGGCGESWSRTYAVIKWFLSGQEGDAPEFEDGCILILQPDGQILMAYDRLPAFPIMGGAAAIGSGGPIAMNYMSSGASAEKAVRATCMTEPYSSEPIQVYKLPKKRKKNSS
ncbi:hypothetical protein ACN9MD_09695 [Stenotrophomonas maltophilia]|uniref:hypothetical protein n=1 Tax=Stenotrophomonas maltophilia TaxID=40324 RepID=UPI003CF8053B